MIQISTWKIVLVFLVCMTGIFYSLPNLTGAAWMQANLPSWGPGKTINLGLDLRGGAHLLYDVDVDAVFVENAEMLESDVRAQFRKAKIGYTRLSAVENGVRFSLRDVSQGEEARKKLRRMNVDMDITTKGSVIEAKFNEVYKKRTYDQTIAQSIEIVRRRIDELGTTEPAIQRQGLERILIQAPGADAEELKALVGTTAKLSFHIVAPSDADDRRNLLTLPMAEDEFQNITIEKRASLSGETLDDAQPNFQDGQPVISFRFNALGARKFCDLTRKRSGDLFAIVLDNEVISAPRINEPICGGAGIISGSFTVQSANQLAMLLRSGALPAPMTVVEERTVGPSLGADSIESGKKASLIGLALVLVFMVVAYGTFGFFANIALLINVSLIFAVLSSLQATLTLPGIAGIVLTIGMAVDANVLIFERIREEFKSGRSVLSAIDAGYRQAMATIVDSNLTTLIAALILFSFGTGPIKGFSVTLGIGIVTSFFSAIMVTRLMVIFWLKGSKKESIPV